MKGSDKPVRTPVDKLATKAMIPKGAYDLEGALYFSRVETYVTLNTPNDAASKPTNQYFELLPITQSTDTVEKILQNLNYVLMVNQLKMLRYQL
ncbi:MULTISPECIES: hypothetical protein [unclassified Pseudoalteromonas]|uniref:hypothetical protein n=1 Tax=unclassified Pseudoalteromonas TaxID=194690 RepID=UPI000694482D|nr:MULTISPECIES: hypothetical protein [unclassified Pseudoalteromonas]